jgi:chromosome partitioning protein
MIVVLGGIKGGTGKSTLATNLTVLRSQTHKVLLVDADKQRSSSIWVETREQLGHPYNWTTIELRGETLHSQIRKLKVDYDDIIIDVGGEDTTTQRSALLAADKFLVPFAPRCFDIWTLGPVKTMITDACGFNENLQSFALINQGDSRGTDNLTAFNILNSCAEFRTFTFVINERKAFGNAASDGLGVVEQKKPDPKAISELNQLYVHLFDSI